MSENIAGRTVKQKFQQHKKASIIWNIYIKANQMKMQSELYFAFKFALQYLGGGKTPFY